MSIQVAIDDKTPELMQKFESAIKRFVREAAGHIEGQLILQKNTPKTGRIYKRRKKAPHQASAPGESPASDSPNLYPSIISVIEANSFEALIGTPVEYAVYLEQGTDTMEPRPLWAKTVLDSLPTLNRMLEHATGGGR